MEGKVLNMRRIKKTIIVLCLMLCLFLLVGFGKKAVELLNNTPLIDLSKAIKEAPIGVEDNTLPSDEKETESMDITDSQEESSTDIGSTIPHEEKESYIISIRDTKITYRDSICKDANDLKDKIIRDCSNGGGSVTLKDDYAETHVYNEVLAILEDLDKDIGLKYEYD